MTLTLDQLLAIFPHAGRLRAAQFVVPLNAAMDEFEINTSARRSAFLAQIGHESGQLQYVREIWGPTAAQKGYEGRKDLGNTRPGDGKRYMGRGLLQITGWANYAECGKALGLNLMASPELLEEPINACRSAAWFWKTRGLNELADAGDQVRVTKRVNGGTNGLQDRLKLFAAAQKVLA